MVTLFTAITASFGCVVLGAYIMHLFNNKDKGYERLISYEDAKKMVETKSSQQKLREFAEPVIGSTDPCNPNAYIIRHYRNGDGSLEGWVVCLRTASKVDPIYLDSIEPYHELEVQDYEENDLPDFGGFEFIYVNEDDNPKYNVVGFVRKEDAESIVETIVETNKKSTFYLVEE